MPEFADRTARNNAALDNAPTRTSTTSAARRNVAPMSYASGRDAVQPKDDPTDVVGPIGRVFNRILGLADNARGTAGKSFNRAQLKGYLDNNLKLADGEWFRGKKLDGVADKLMATLDTNTDGLVGWVEFQAFQAQVLQSIAPGVGPDSTTEQVDAASGGQFDAMDKDRKDGKLGYGEIFEGTKGALPKDTDHADLVAQLGARIALDAVDTDQRGEKVKDRSLSRTEWTTAARELSSASR